MTRYAETSDRLTAAHARFRARTAHLLPPALTNYPFEVLAAFLGLIVGLPLLAGLAAPTSLVTILPAFGYWAYAVALVLGGGTTAVGLRTKHPLALASGLQLLGGSYVVYGLATVAVAGWAVAWLSFGAYAVLGGLAIIRALHFRRLVDIQRGATHLRENGNP